MKIGSGSNEVNVSREFLEKQLAIYHNIKEGNSTWSEVNNLRRENGFPEISIDSIRRSFYQIGAYEDSGWKLEPPAPSSASELSRKDDDINDNSNVTVNYDKGLFTSVRQIKLTNSELFDTTAVLKAHGFNPDDFDIKTVNNAKVRRVNTDGEESYYYSSRITVKPKAILGSDIEWLCKYFNSYKSEIINKKNYDSLINDSSLYRESLLIPLYDLHWGRLPEQENFKSYNIEEEKQKIIEHVNQYVDKFKDRKFSKIYLVIGQDFLNSSFTGYTSSQSHLQQNAVDFRTMFRTGCELLIDIINLFYSKMSFNSFEIIGSLGNHDTAEEYAMFQMVKAYYRTLDGLHVDDSAAPRKYIKIGNSGVGIGHLDKEGKRVFGLMQVEAKDIWYKTNNHIFIAGHLHHFRVENEQGVELYRVPSICPDDRWTQEQGYVQTEKKTMCFVFDEDHGLVETHFMYL